MRSRPTPAGFTMPLYRCASKSESVSIPGKAGGHPEPRSGGHRRSIGGHGDLLFAGVREVAYRRSLPLTRRKLQVLATALGERAGVLGLA